MTEVIIASDYRGVDLKNELLLDSEFSKEISFIDVGIESGSKLDYIDISKILSDAILFKPDGFAIILCATGHGAVIALNRYAHIRAATCNNINDAINSREKLNANVLCMSSKCVDFNLAKKIINAFVNKSFLPGKHDKCLKKLAANQTAHHKNGVNLIARAIIEHQDHILLTTATIDNKNFAQDLFFFYLEDTWNTMNQVYWHSGVKYLKKWA